MSTRLSTYTPMGGEKVKTQDKQFERAKNRPKRSGAP